MIEQTTAPPILGISGKLSRPERKIRLALDGYTGTAYPFERRLVPGYHECVGFRDIPQGTRIGDFQNQRVVETARPLENRSASAAASKDGDVFIRAGMEIDLLTCFSGISYNHEVQGGLPEPQDLIFVIPLAHLEQRLVASEIMLRN